MKKFLALALLLAVKYGCITQGQADAIKHPQRTPPSVSAPA